MPGLLNIPAGSNGIMPVKYIWEWIWEKTTVIAIKVQSRIVCEGAEDTQ
jgi:hypothetical protein